MSLWYLAVRLLQDYPLEPLFIVQPYMTLLLWRGVGYQLPEGRVVENQSQLPEQIFSLRSGVPSCITLVEWGNKRSDSPPYLEWNSLLPIFASSPDHDRTQGFISARDPFLWGMPTWTRLELIKG